MTGLWTAKAFNENELRQAREWSLLGGISVYLHPITEDNAGSFHYAAKRGERVAHVYCMTSDTLAEIAEKYDLPLEKVTITMTAENDQYISMCGRPLAQLLSDMRKR